MGATDPELAESVYYYWKVIVRDKFLQESESSVFKFRVDATKPFMAMPISPGNENADKDDPYYWINTKTPTFKWEPPDDIEHAGYSSGISKIKLEISKDKDFLSTIHNSEFLYDSPVYNGCSYTLPSADKLDGFGPFYWRIVTYDTAGNYTVSKVFEFNMDFVPPDYFSINYEYPDSGSVNLTTLRISPIGPNKETENAYDPLCDIGALGFNDSFDGTVNSINWPTVEYPIMFRENGFGKSDNGHIGVAVTDNSANGKTVHSKEFDLTDALDATAECSIFYNSPSDVGDKFKFEAMFFKDNGFIQETDAVAVFTNTSLNWVN
ncbi:MAG TPA: hypothetical protein PKL57_21935, partial [Candidatus Wallbacteria bacterium]|nr:hypothetical protein [Candidatus Wallbacteria bacterium]